MSDQIYDNKLSNMLKSFQSEMDHSFLTAVQGKIDHTKEEIENAKTVIDAAQKKADKFLLAVDLLIASVDALLLIQEDGKFCTCPFCTATRHSLDDVKEQMKGYRINKESVDCE